MALPTQIEERLKVLGVRSADVEEKFVRGAGPGGQKINKTSSTVWLRHGPTGVEVRCQRERSQAANREVAWAELCAKLESRVRAAKARGTRRSVGGWAGTGGEGGGRWRVARFPASGAQGRICLMERDGG